MVHFNHINILKNKDLDEIGITDYIKELSNNVYPHIGNFSSIISDYKNSLKREAFIYGHKKAIERLRLTQNLKYDCTVFTSPFRLGRAQKRVILDANGKEVIIFPLNSEIQAQLYVNYLNT